MNHSTILSSIRLLDAGLISIGFEIGCLSFRSIGYKSQSQDTLVPIY